MTLYRSEVGIHGKLGTGNWVVPVDRFDLRQELTGRHRLVAARLLSALPRETAWVP